MVNIPIVTLDKIYVSPDEVNIFFLDCTRISGTNEIVSRKNENLDQQVLRLSQRLRGKKVILADDVIFSGSVLRKIISKLNDQGVKVVGVVSSICTNNAYEYFNNNLDCARHLILSLMVILVKWHLYLAIMLMIFLKDVLKEAYIYGMKLTN